MVAVGHRVERSGQTTPGTPVGRGVSTHRIQLVKTRNRRLKVISVRSTLLGTRRTGLSLIRVSTSTMPPIYGLVSCNGSVFRGGGRITTTGGGRGRVRIGRVGFHPKARRKSCRMGLHGLMHFLDSKSETGMSLQFHNHRVTRRRLKVRLLGQIRNSLLRCNSIRRRPGVRKHRLVVIVTPGGGGWSFKRNEPASCICRLGTRCPGVPGVGAGDNTTGQFLGATGNVGRGRTFGDRVLAGVSAGHGHRLHNDDLLTPYSITGIRHVLHLHWFDRR